MFGKKAYYYGFSRHRRIARRLIVLAIILFALLAAGSFWVHRSYNRDLQPVSSDTATEYVTIATGTPAEDIAELLYDRGLIRSVDAFQWYITSRGIRDKLQAGTYQFSPSQSTADIANTIAEGKVATDLFTILPGQTMAEIRKAFIVSGFKVTDVDAALRPEVYAGHPALVDSPAGSGLEGFLYPDSYQKNADTDPSEIITRALDEMQGHLTPAIRQGFAQQGLSVYRGVTLASIVEREVANQRDRELVAQVFIKRLRINMPLGSDPTIAYAKSVNDPSYNTYNQPDLPPGPIGTVSVNSLKAVAQPASTDWLYFVSGDDGTTHFSKTLQEHEALTEKYCHKNCSQ